MTKGTWSTEDLITVYKNTRLYGTNDGSVDGNCLENLNYGMS
jgi:hypothetical protein